MAVTTTKTTTEVRPASAHKRRANDLICESLRDATGLEPIAFFCECPRSRCFDTVWMTAAEYETRRNSAHWAPRAVGH